MEYFQRSKNYKKDRLLEFTEIILQNQLHCDVATSTDDLNEYADPPLESTLQDEIKSKIEKLEQWEATKTVSLERLSILIDIIKAKHIEIRRKEMELLQKMRSRRSSVEIEERVSSTDNSLSKTNRKRKLKKSIDQYQNAKRMRFSKNDHSDEENIDTDLIVIGPNQTKVPKSIIKAIDWQSVTSATRSLLMAVFDRKTLAFHTLTGKRSPAFVDCDIPIKDQLDPSKVADIIHIVTKNCNARERDVKMAITTKCADENKMFKQREKRRSLLQNKQ